MKMKRFFIAVSVAVLASAASVAYASSPDARTDIRSSAASQAHDAPDLSLDDILKVPVIPEKNREKVKAYMRKEAENLVKLGYRVETMRRGEVVIVTVPSDLLFRPNGTDLVADEANRLLRPLAAYLRVPERYRLVMAVHTDDTGSAAYTAALATSRVEAIYDYFDRIAQHPEDLVGYPVGQDRPESDNSTRASRAANRRVEFYIVPGPELIRSIAKRAR